MNQLRAARIKDKFIGQISKALISDSYGGNSPECISLNKTFKKLSIKELESVYKMISARI